MESNAIRLCQLMLSQQSPLETADLTSLRRSVFLLEGKIFCLSIPLRRS